MIQLDPADTALDALVGECLQSENQAEDQYRVVRRLGGTESNVSLLALKESAGGVTPVVVKIVTPAFVRAAGSAASLSVQKEVQALRRLNQQTPPTPFVVRLLDNGVAHALVGGAEYQLGWLAQEYVHGGAEGGTLDLRVAYSITSTGAGFDPLRATDAIRCLTSGLEAVHAVDVIHRNLAPVNVLCCGFGDREILKIANFGLARPGGMSGTFHAAVGTPGYSAPEQLYASGQSRALGSADVFGLAALIYFMLTGEQMFTFKSLPDMVQKLTRGERPAIRHATRLSPALRDSPSACKALDEALARATDLDPDKRHQSPKELGETIYPILLSPRQLNRTTFDRLPTLSSEKRGSWEWIERCQGWPQGVVTAAAYDGDGRCLAATSSGLAFWDGAQWRAALPPDAPQHAAEAVFRSRAGEWLVAARAALFTYSAEGVNEVARYNDPRVRFTGLSGNVRQTVAVGINHLGTPALFFHSRRGWMDPLPVAAAALPCLARLTATHWLVGGRDGDDRGFLALWTPLAGELEQLSVPRTRAFISCATDTERGIALALGTGGVAISYDGRAVRAESIPADTPLTVAALDEGGGMWAGGVGALWYRAPEPTSSWTRAWSAEGQEAPLIAVHTEAGVTRALSATGALIEGSSPAGNT